MTKHRTKEEKLKRIRLGLRYVGLDLAQFYWECLKVAAASEELSETDILRRIVRSWSESLPLEIQEKARAEAASVEAWKNRELRARKEARLQATRAKLKTREVKLKQKGPSGRLEQFLRSQERVSVSN